MLYAVILAGGSGTRLWPSSRKRMPKQAIPLIEGKSLFQLALTRVEGWVPPERTFVITNADQADILAAQAPHIPRGNIVGEPLARDSAAAIFLAAAITKANDPEAVNLVMPADHLLSPVERFRETARRAIHLAEEGMLATFGVKPRYPATGYGYIERGEPIGCVENAYRVVRFKEKPDVETAKAYIASGRFYWNSGMFAWRAQAVLDAARIFARKHHDTIEALGARFGVEGFEEALRDAYEPLKKISIDYAVMEKAPNIGVVEADFDWSDVGSHTAMREFANCDESGNVCLGAVEAVDSANCVVSSSHGHLVALFGCKDMVVVHTQDATLVVPADRAQDLKTLIARLEAKDNLKKYL